MPDLVARDHDLQATYLVILTIWGAASIIGGTILAWRMDGMLRTAGIVSAVWGVINMFIGINSSIAVRTRPLPTSLPDALSGAITNQQIVTGALVFDIASVAIGAMLIWPAITVERPDLRGIGWATLIQGAVLLFFDAYLIVRFTQYVQGLLNLFRS